MILKRWFARKRPIVKLNEKEENKLRSGERKCNFYVLLFYIDWYTRDDFVCIRTLSSLRNTAVKLFRLSKTIYKNRFCAVDMLNIFSFSFGYFSAVV